MLSFDFDFRNGGGLSWMQWETLLGERAKRAAAIDGMTIAVETGAKMTPYDPSAGGTQPIMHYFRYGWKGDRAQMKPRWPPGTVSSLMQRDRPYQRYLSWINRWVMFGNGNDLPRDTSYEIWKSMAGWIENNLFGNSISPEGQWRHYRAGRGGAYGPGSTFNPIIINAWEKDPAEAARVKLRASRPAKYDSRFADVAASHDPSLGFLRSMWDRGPRITKGT